MQKRNTVVYSFSETDSSNRIRRVFLRRGPEYGEYYLGELVIYQIDRFPVLYEGRVLVLSSDTSQSNFIPSPIKNDGMIVTIRR